MNFGGSRLGFWFRPVDRGLKSKKVLVFYDPLTNMPANPEYQYNYYDSGDPRPQYELWPVIEAREIALGFQPELCTSFADLALLNLNEYSHVWDIGYATPYVTNPDNPTAQLTSYMQQGGAMFLLGENIYFQPRDTTIDNFVMGLGGGTISQTTNPAVSTGDGVALALRAGAEIEDVEFIQFHPTVLWRDETEKGQQPLISEAVRGEGAFLVNDKGERFMLGVHPQADLAPRDIVAKEIFKQMKEHNTPHVWLDATKVMDFKERFPTIYQSCLDNGIDPTSQLIPVSPASHYASGGVKVDYNGETRIKNLYACGETACTGAHGANRLASNSLLEGLVFGTRIAESIAKNLGETEEPVITEEKIFLMDPAIKMPLQLAMSKGAGVLRSKKSLQDTLAILEQLGTHQSSSPRIESWEVSNLYQLALAIVKAALTRTETRGSHWRSDFPDQSDNWRKHIIQSVDLNGVWSLREEGVK